MKKNLKNFADLKICTTFALVKRNARGNSSVGRAYLALKEKGFQPWQGEQNKEHRVNAEIAQLVEHNLAKVGVASSSLVFRSLKF